MSSRFSVCCRAVLAFYFFLFTSVAAQDSNDIPLPERTGYSKGDIVPVSCLNRTIETGEHITDAHGNLQYISFPICNETNQVLSFRYGVPQSFTCTIDSLPDETYHLLEFFVHNDAPLTCRVPTYPLTNDALFQSTTNAQSEGTNPQAPNDVWTPFTIALQGTLQLSHLHLHTNINVLFHTSHDTTVSKLAAESHLIASTAYSLPNTTLSAEGAKIIRNEPLTLTFNVGWIDGVNLPGMIGRPVLSIKDHSVGFTLLSFFAVAASAGVGAMAMLVYERRKSGRSVYANGILGGNVGAGGGPIGGGSGGLATRATGYGGYGGYGGYNSATGKRD